VALFGSIFGKSQPAPLPTLIRETLFGDMPLEQWPTAGVGKEVLPWSMFETARSNLSSGNRDAAIEWWRQIIQQPNLEPRHYLQAWHFLRQNGQAPSAEAAKQVLGVVIEVGMPKGSDMLAAYSDYSARYWNFSGAGVVWEHPDKTLDVNIGQLLAASKLIVDKIGPWDQVRPVPPPNGQARLNFLTPSGLHFGQAPMAALVRDPMAGKVFQLATALMQSLIAKSKQM
jgi:hypothetical protein